MKILWFAHRDMQNPRSGGAERTIEEICKRLVSYGHDVHLFTVAWKNAPLEVDFEGVKIHRTRGNIYTHFNHRRLLKKHEDANVIVDDLGHVVPWSSNRMTNVPGVALFRHLHLRTLSGQVNLFKRIILVYLEKNYKYFYPNWEFVTESIVPASDLERIGINPKRINIIKPGIDHNKFKCDIDHIPGKVIYFAGMRKYKRADHAIIAFKQLLDVWSGPYNLKLVMIGNGPTFKELKKLSDDLGLSDKVLFTGKLHDSDLIRTISESSVNIHCSVEEGWCYSPLEASACGVPTVAYYNEGLADEIVDSVTGILCKEGDIKSLSIALKEVIEKSSYYSTNCCLYSDSYSWDISARQWEAMLKRISENRQKD